MLSRGLGMVASRSAVGWRCPVVRMAGKHQFEPVG
jgi:hypothetical protein